MLTWRYHCIKNDNTIHMEGKPVDRKKASTPPPHTQGHGNEPVGRHILTHQGTSTRASHTSQRTTPVSRGTVCPEQTVSKFV